MSACWWPQCQCMSERSCQGSLKLTLIVSARFGSPTFHYPDGENLLNWFTGNVEPHSAGHPAQKPTYVVDYCVGPSSSPGDIVLDPALKARLEREERTAIRLTAMLQSVVERNKKLEAVAEAARFLTRHMQAQGCLLPFGYGDLTDKLAAIDAKDGA